MEWSNQLQWPQAIHIAGVVDGPRTELDRTFAQDVKIPANGLVTVHDDSG